MQNTLKSMYNNWRISQLYKNRDGEKQARETFGHVNKLITDTKMQPDQLYLQTVLAEPMLSYWSDAHIYLHFNTEDLNIPDAFREAAKKHRALLANSLVKICDTAEGLYQAELGRYIPPHKGFAYGVSMKQGHNSIFVTAGDNILKPEGRYARLLS